MSIGVTFVCLGNICRSPLAEGIFQQLLTQAELSDQVRVDSCGTAAFNVGKSPDPRAVAAAERAGLNISRQVARQIHDEDYAKNQYIVAMDRANLMNCEAWRTKDFKGEIKMLLEYSQTAGSSQVADPFYSTSAAFDELIPLLRRACEDLLAHIIKMHNLKPLS
jgi:protein-tyrosine phosphatase